MRFIDEYRDADLAQRYADAITSITTQPWTIMEICGGQTHSIVRFGIEELLPKEIELVHGPGCPVCVTPVAMIDRSIDIALTPGCVLCSFGDMLRVPGSNSYLLRAKAMGGDVRAVYSPLDAVRMAEADPSRKYVFFTVGFETTAPANALAVRTAAIKGLKNFSILIAHVCVPPAIEVLLSFPDNQVQGFLAAGHVCAVMGTEEYDPIAERFKVPIVVTGFEPADILLGTLMCVRQLEEGRHEVENVYGRVVRREGNTPARNLVTEVFQRVDREWRGLGVLPGSGMGLRDAYKEFDAALVFGLETGGAPEPSDCMAAEILKGKLKPRDCKAFGTRCTPENPLGAPMVSSEGACAAYYRYQGVKETRT